MELPDATKEFLLNEKESLGDGSISDGFGEA